MSIHYTNDEERRLLLLEQRAMIDAELANIPNSSDPSASLLHHGQRQAPRQSVPRSYSHNGQSMSRTFSSGPGHHEAIPMSASMSQRSAPTIASTGMQGCQSSGSSIPFAKSGRLPHLQTADGRRDTSVIESWATSLDDSSMMYTLHPRQPVRSLSQRKSDLRQVDEIDSGEHPDDYFARRTVLMYSASPNHRGSTPSRRRQSFGIPTPTTPSSAVLTTGTTFASEMSRQNSLSNDAILGPFEMMHVHSNTSILTDSNSTDERCRSSIPFPKFLSSEEQSQVLVGVGGAGEDSHLPYPFQDIGAIGAPVAQFPSLPSFMGDMKRSPSNESDSSSSSATSRAATQLKRQNQLASRPLAPKAGSDEVAMSREGSHAMISMKSKDGLENRPVQPITKVPYQRPKHDRVYCTICTECPEGFRGQHELGRHNDRCHKEQVRKWVCVEPADGIINPEFRPVNPLSRCKACSSQKKKYGAYYNAAAHLRRAHFRPKQRGRAKSAKAEEKSEKRGGKGGGDWPPMPELKRWMKEIHENVTDGQQQDEENEEEVEDDDCSGSYENDDNYTKLQDISNISSTNLDFDNGYIYGDTPMLDAYPAPASNFNPQTMQSMAYDNLSITQNIDLSMRIDSSQSSFADSHFASMNDMTFIDPFTQNYADQIIGSDSFHNFQYQM